MIFFADTLYMTSHDPEKLVQTNSCKTIKEIDYTTRGETRALIRE